ncbi:MAG TPA: hypothetical protein VEH79_01980 [Gaiellaceae bacterium]|nr:hypothetical protein [Gaiellaceae bacterium]
MDGVRFPARHGTRMGGRIGWWVAVALAAVALLLLGGTVPLSDAAGMHSAVGVGFLLGLVAFVVVGFMLVRARPRNPIGWATLGAGFFGGVTSFAGPYAVDAYRLHHHLPLAPVAVFLQPTWAPTIFLIALAVMLFPDGVLPSGRWRWAMGAVAAVGTVWMIGAFAIAAETIALHQVTIEPSGDLSRINNPTSGWAWWSVVQNIWFVLLLCVGVFWLVSRVPAYRAASGERRAQLKWLICGGSVACVGIVLTVVLSNATGVVGFIGSVATFGLLGIPLSIGVGISKYRLYEIDRLISRTISYLILTGLLVGTFLGIVLLTTRVLPFSSPVAVAASTLTAAALFNPLRRKIQHTVDRRFNRSRYDQETIVADFRTRLRTAADPDTVRASLQTTVDTSVQPSHLSVWLRPSPKPDA